jgi:glycosyltransferase involved in cell wall biosynthesis
MTVPRLLAFFIQDLRPGGAEWVVVKAANGCAALGLPVAVVLVRGGDALVNHLDPRIQVVVLGCSRTWRSPVPLARWLRSAQPRALFANLENASVAAVLARRLCPSWRGHLVVVEHNVFTGTLQDLRGGERWSAWAARATYAEADALIGVSRDAVREWLKRLGPDCPPTRVIHNPVVDDQFGSRQKADPVPAFPDSGRWLIGVGRLAPQKDWPTLLQAMTHPLLSHERLALLGEGPLRPTLESQIHDLGLTDRVWMPGQVTDPLPHLARSALMVLPSRYEGFGNVVVEALACGTPVVATSCDGGPQEILEAGRWGRLVPPGQPVLLAEAIAATLAEPRRSEDLRRRANDFHVGQAARQYVSLVEALDREAQR